jgi:hypothetical protein
MPALDTTVLNLGKDVERMTTKSAGDQHASVDCLLGAFFGPIARRREVQLLADEVGLGKTFVALAVAYTTLSVLREKNPPPFVADLANAYRAVVVVTPQGNRALATKWGDEVGALVKRCGLKPEALEWFRSILCETPEELLVALRKASDMRRAPSSVQTVIVCEAGMFTRKIRESSTKLRFFTATLFQWLGPAIRHEVRGRIVRCAAKVRGYEDWVESGRPNEYVDLWDFEAHERYLSLPVDDPLREEFSERNAFAAVPFRYSEMCDALKDFERTDDGRDLLYSEHLSRDLDKGPLGIVAYCKWVFERRGKAELYFDGFKSRASRIHRSLFPSLISRTIPLMIVDEAHHWRHETQGCRAVIRYLAPFTHRLLLLTATPFQLCPEELHGILSRADAMAPTIGAGRVAVLSQKRAAALSAMERSREEGRAFSKLWGRLGDDLRATCNSPATNGHHVADEAEERTKRVLDYWRIVRSAVGSLEECLEGLPGRVRPFFAAALRLQQANAQLGEVMRELVVRHRRETAYRRYRVGHEFPPDKGESLRPDQHQLHAARGSPLPSDAELAQFLLMKVVASATRGRRKTALGMDVTGAYSTLWNSSEGKKALSAAAQSDVRPYFSLLTELTGGSKVPNSQDPLHPKVRLAVKAALDCWKNDEKTLIFCFRIPTAKVLHDLISEEIEKHIASARRVLLRGRRASSAEAALTHFKRSLTARNGSVLPAFMDRVLLGLAQRKGWSAFDLDLDDLRLVADFAARACIAGKPAVRNLHKPDRVLLARICEHVLAKKYQRCVLGADTETADVLARIADPAWIETRYAMGSERWSEAVPDETTDLLTRSSLAASYKLTDHVDQVVFRSLLEGFTRSRARAGNKLLASLIGGPNIFVPLVPFQLEPTAQEVARRMTEQLWRITLQPHGIQWEQRAEVFDAVNRALLRDHFLLRLPRDVFSGDDERWSEALVRGFHSTELFGGRSESVAGKIADYLQELAQMTAGERSHSLRYALNQQGKAVVLVSGATRERDAVFRGFNSPLLPEILICTQVGQEGIDLHRHCSHVIHYDLGWNPATLEQRTGRIDRIGSKTQRQRKLVGDGAVGENALPGLEVALPYLAATYDERMFDELYARAQAFDLLTGGDASADPDDEHGYEIDGIEQPGKDTQLVALPDEMRLALRVELRAAHCHKLRVSG